MWSFGYHTLIYASAVCSAVASVLLKIDFLKDKHASDISAILAACAALCSTLLAGGGFARKWKANRIARGKVRKLLLEIQNPAPDAAAIRKQLEEVIEEQDKQIADI